MTDGTPSETGGSETGSALLGVMMFAAVASLVLAVLIGRIVVEHHAVEDSIAQTRAYWAAMGFNNYVLSRTLVSGVCPKKGCDAGQTDYIPAENSFLAEITDLQNWYYMDVGSNYMIQLNSVVCQDSYAPGSASGEVVIKTAFSGNGGKGPPGPACPVQPIAGTPPATCPPPAKNGPATIEALRTLPGARPVEFRFCLVASGVASCGAGPQGDAGARRSSSRACTVPRADQGSC